MVDLVVLRQKLDAAMDEVGRITRTGKYARERERGEVRVSIPCRPEYDTDIRIGDALIMVESLMKEVEERRAHKCDAAAERVRKLLDG